MSARSISIIIAIAVLCLGLAAWYVMATGPDTMPAFANDQCAFESGERLSYALTATTEATYEAAALLSDRAVSSDEASKRAERELKGTLSLRVMERTDERAKIAGQLAMLTVYENGEPVAEGHAGFRKIFRFTVRMDCRIGDISFDGALSRDDRMLIANLMKEVQFVLPRRAGLKHWKVIEQDSLGKYVARYVVEDANEDAVTVGKRKRKYRSLFNPNPAMPITARIKRSRAEATFERGRRWFDRFEGAQSVTLSADGRSFVDATSTIELKSLSEPVTGIALWDARDHVHDLMKFKREEVTSACETCRETYEPSYPAGDVVGLAWSEVRADYERLLDADNPADRRKGLDIMIQYLRNKPKAAEELIAAIKDGDLAKAYQAKAFLALQLADTTESQEVMVEALGDRDMSAMNRMRSAIALQDVIDPLPDVATSLIDEMRKRPPAAEDDPDQYNVSRTAALALGALGGNARANNPALAAQVSAELKQALAQERDPSEISLLIEAIGNMKDPAMADEIRPYLSSDDPRVQSVAAAALKSLKKDAIGSPQ